MNFTLLIYVLVGVVVQTINAGIVVGAGCWASCWAPCSAVGPFKFAAAVGVVFDIAGCGAMCGAICAAGVAIPLYCFAPNSTFLNENNDILEVSNMKVGDLVMTLEHGELVPTKVNNITVSEGGFKFLNFHLTAADGVDNNNTDQYKTLTVTDSHEVIVLEDNSHVHFAVHNAKIGHFMVGADLKQWKIASIESVEFPTMYNVITESNTALSSGLLVGTSCVH